MSASVFTLPIPLVLLIHLHILEYPHANKPEYDHNVFEPRVRGLKERTKLLEDISYFLVGRLEGNAKTILATYPCLVPSDTVAFRTSLSKYLETLRHNSIYPTSKTATGSKLKEKEQGKTSDLVTWWWKDVVVRKSLLEECAGERFQRLLLSLSTHALFKCSASRIDIENINAIFTSQPTIYADLLRKSKHARNTWTQSASILLHREAELHALKNRLRSSNKPHLSKSKYTSLSTNDLITRVESKYHTLLQSSWSGETGKGALEFLVKQAGIEPVSNSTDASRLVLRLDVGSNASNPPPAPAPVPVPAQPLPIAAAHHPAYLRKIRKPIFTNANADVKTQPPVHPNGPTSTTSELILETETRTHQALKEALRKMMDVGKELRERVRMLEGKRKTRAGVRDKAGGSRKKPPPQAPWTFDLWEPGDVGSVDFETKPTPSLLASFGLGLGLGLDTDEEEGGLEVRIDEIRERALTGYPPVVDLGAPRVAYVDCEVGLVEGKGTEKMKLVGDGKVVTSTPRVGVGMGKGKGVKKVEGRGVEKKQKPRKSIRMSLAAHAKCRPSLFAPPSLSPGPSSPFDEDVNQIIHSVIDTSTEVELNDDGVHNNRTHDAGVLSSNTGQDAKPKTAHPRTKKANVNRIFTGSARGATQDSESFPGPDVWMEPAVPLPGVGWSGAGEGGEVGDDDEYEYEGDEGSMTLRDILLSADVSGVLLDEGGEVGDDIAVDGSFEWE